MPGSDYFAAQAAQGVMEASLQIELGAGESYQAAMGRVNPGVAPISGALQAQMALAQATFNRAKAKGDWDAALGCSPLI